METAAFPIEYHSDTPELNDTLKAKVEKRLGKLTHRNRDTTGASIAVHTSSGDTMPREYRVRVVLYQRPENVAVVEKGDNVSATLLKALDVAERQVRERREKLRQKWKRRR